MKKSLMVVYSFFPDDTRIRKEANALIQNHYEVDVICLKNGDQPSFEVFENVKINRLNIRKIRGNIFNYIYLYLLFFVWSFFKVNLLFIKRNYDIIHVHNMPNFIVFTAIIPKLFGKKIILDLHDPFPEILLSLTNKSIKSTFYKLLLLEEKVSVWFADLVITTNIAFKELFVSRGCPEKKITIVMNSPQTNIFNQVKLTDLEFEGNNKKFRLMYNGTIIERHGLDLLVDAIMILRNKIPEIELSIYGDGEFLDGILEKIELLSLKDVIIYKGSFLVDRIAEEISKIDLGVIPNRLNVFTNLNFPVRIFEFIHFKKPVIVPKTRGISDYFPDDSIFYFQPENVKNLADNILSIYNKTIDVQKIVANGYRIYQENDWERQVQNLMIVYKSL